MSLRGVIFVAPLKGTPRNLGILQRVANAPLICHVLSGLGRLGAGEAAVVLDRDERDEIQRAIEADRPAGVEIQYIEREPADMTSVLAAGACAGAMLAASAFVDGEPCIVQAAEGVLCMAGASLVRAVEQSSDGLTALLYRSAPGGGSIGFSAHKLARLAGLDPGGPATELAGACVLGPGVFERLTGAGVLRPGGLDVLAAAEWLAARGHPPDVQRVEAWLEYGGEANRLLAINQLLLDLAAPEWPDWEPMPGTRIEGQVMVHPSASVRASTVVGPAIIGPGALVADSYIGPYTSIDAGVHIEGAEIERSIILPGASIMHIGGRLVGSVVGRETKIFRDFSLPRALRLNVGDGGEVALC